MLLRSEAQGTTYESFEKIVGTFMSKTKVHEGWPYLGFWLGFRSWGLRVLGFRLFRVSKP